MLHGISNPLRKVYLGPLYVAYLSLPSIENDVLVYLLAVCRRELTWVKRPQTQLGQCNIGGHLKKYAHAGRIIKHYLKHPMIKASWPECFQ